jgi:hypothetical protein
MADKINIQTNKVLYTSPLGTPVYSDLDITGDSFTDETGPHSFSDIKIPGALMKVRRTKNIIFTEINGLNSEVLEYMGAKNYEIEIEFVINGTSLLYPTADVTNILNMLSSNQVLTVNSWYLNQFGITNIVILDEDEPQERGNLNNQKISYKAMAVRPLVLTFGVGNSARSPNNAAANATA